MTLEELYEDVNIFCKGELTVPEFLLYYDMAVTRYLARYPRLLLMPEGEYVRPESLSEGVCLPDCFYHALTYYISGYFLANDALFDASDDRAEDAFRTLWRAHARGKRIRGDTW